MLSWDAGLRHAVLWAGAVSFAIFVAFAQVCTSLLAHRLQPTFWFLVLCVDSHWSVTATWLIAVFVCDFIISWRQLEDFGRCLDIFHEPECYMLDKYMH